MRGSGSVLVFLVEHSWTVQVAKQLPGETLWHISLKLQSVPGCPAAVAEALPGQAISCALPHMAVPNNLKEATTQAMLELTDMMHSWTDKVLAVEEGTCGPVYSVELAGNSFTPPLDMRKELAFMAFPLLEWAGKAVVYIKLLFYIMY